LDKPVRNITAGKIAAVLSGKTALLILGGCCYFVPCHPATYTTGIVIDGISKQAITKANVRLYCDETHTAPSGCFALGGADALPFEFGVSAPGYKPLIVKAVPGFYPAKITLMPEGSGAESVSKFNEISRERYNELSRGCP
jgi:hypothetical protein